MSCVATAGEKIKHLRETRKPKLTQKKLGEMIGISRNVVANIEGNRTDPEERVLRKLAKMWGIQDPMWFWDGGPVEPSPRDVGSPGLSAPGSPPPPPSAQKPAMAQAGVGRRLFPVVGEAGMAEFPLASDGSGYYDQEHVVEFSDDLFRAERFGIKVKGDSNHPRIKHGTFALIHPDPNPPTGVFVAARNDRHEYCVKVLRVVGGQTELHPYNPEYPVIKPGDGWVMIGYVVGLREERGPRKYIEEGDNDGIRP
jgi:SOS-response transcriptional repressor LexA